MPEGIVCNLKNDFLLKNYKITKYDVENVIKMWLILRKYS